MGKFTEMFKKRKAVVAFIDLDEKNKIIASSGDLEGKYQDVIAYDPQK